MFIFMALKFSFSVPRLGALGWLRYLIVASSGDLFIVFSKTLLEKDSPQYVGLTFAYSSCFFIQY